jgi:HEAT repeat protein/S1-C subfamily serine protease
MIDVTCPKCRVELEVPTTQAGSRVTCPECEHTFVVPKAGAVKPGRPTSTKAEPPRGPRSSGARPPALPPGGKRPPKRRRDEEDEEDDDSGSGSNLGLILGLTGGGVLLLALLGVGLFFLLRNPSNNNAQASNNPTTPPTQAVRPPLPIPGGPPPNTGPNVPRPTTPAGIPPAANPPTTKATPPKPKDPPPLKPSSTPSAQESGLYGHVLKSMVWLVVPLPPTKIGFGSGSLVDQKNRLVLTNYHVVQNAREIAVLFPLHENDKLVQNRDTYMEMVNHKPDSVIKGRVVAKDQKHDLALVQLLQMPDDALSLAVAAKDVEPGQSVHSVGNPGDGGFLWQYAPGKVRNVSYKHTWQVRTGEGPNDFMEMESDVIVTDSPTNPGDSGGPLVNDRGELVGVTHGGNMRSRGMSLFINRSEVLKFIEAYCSNNNVVWDKSDRKVEGAGGFTEADLPALVGELGSTDATARARAAQHLGAMGPKAKNAVDALMKLLQDPDKLAKKLALTALGNIGPDARPACDALLAVLKDPADASMREEAARALGKIGSAIKSRAFPALTAALDDHDKSVRLAAVEAMASMGPLDAGDLPVVLKVLKSTDPEFRAPAARALGQFTAQAKEVIPELIAAYNAGDDKAVRVAVLSSLGNFGTEAAAAVAVLTDGLKHSNPEVVRAASQTAAKIGPAADKLVPEMSNALEKGDVPTRKEILTALQKLGPAAKDAAPALAKVLGEKDRGNRLGALAVLEGLGKDAKPAVPGVISLFAEERDLESRIMNVLTKVGKDAVPDLGIALTNPSPLVRLGAAKTLGALGPVARPAARKLGQMIQRETIPQVHAAAVEAYQRITGR